jgi:hypothetical protein
VDQPRRHQDIVDESMLAEQHHPREGAHDDAGEIGQHDRQHDNPDADAGRRRQVVGDRVTDQQCRHGDDQRNPIGRAECRQISLRKQQIPALLDKFGGGAVEFRERADKEQCQRHQEHADQHRQCRQHHQQGGVPRWGCRDG